jgi:carbamoyl-phosphate synthase large subunit
VNDLELNGLAQRAPCFRQAGTLPVVATPKIVAMCQDKWAAFQFLKAHDIPTPLTYLTPHDARTAVARGVLQYPLLIKPRWGTSSIGMEVVENDRELSLADEWGKIGLRRTVLAKLGRTDDDNCFVFQEWLQGQEYGLDVVNDLEGHYVATLARRKLVMRTGNTDRAVTVTEPRFERLGNAIGEHFGHIGNLDCDVMVTEKGCFVLDLNPRFGGGYPFSHLAGANIPAALIAWANGEEPNPSWFQPRPGVMSAKYDGMVVIDRDFPSVVAGQTCQGTANRGLEAASRPAEQWH